MKRCVAYLLIHKYIEKIYLEKKKANALGKYINVRVNLIGNDTTILSYTQHVKFNCQ